MIAEASMVFSSIKTAIDIVNGLKTVHDTATIMQAKSDILEQLFSIRAEALTLQEKHLVVINEKEKLINKLAQFERWGETESEYELQEIGCGTFANAFKESQQSKKPMHWLCAQCWDDHKKSILQETRPYGCVRYTCSRCDLTLIPHTNNKST